MKGSQFALASLGGFGASWMCHFLLTPYKRYGSGWHYCVHQLGFIDGEVMCVSVNNEKVLGRVCRDCGHVDVDTHIVQDVICRQTVYGREAKGFVWAKQ